MRTTLYLSAALAAMCFSLEASAVALASTELQQADALAETFIDADINLDAETEKVGLPANMNELFDIMQNGTSAKGDLVLRAAVKRCLNGENQGDGAGKKV